MVAIALSAFLVFFEFFDSVCVAEGIEGVLAAGIAGRDICDHGGLGIAHEGIFEDLCQFTSSKRSMFLFQIECSDAFLQCKETLINLRTI